MIDANLNNISISKDDLLNQGKFQRILYFQMVNPTKAPFDKVELS